MLTCKGEGGRRMVGGWDGGIQPRGHVKGVVSHQQLRDTVAVMLMSVSSMVHVTVMSLNTCLLKGPMIVPDASAAGRRATITAASIAAMCAGRNRSRGARVIGLLLCKPPAVHEPPMAPGASQ